MVKQLNTAQKRGLLIILGALILIAGWRYRAAHAAHPGATSELPTHSTSAPAKLDLNTADTTALQTIQGIGPASARRIVRYRSLIGGFSSTDQLLKVWGISPENFIRIEEQVMADTTTAAFAALRSAKPQRSSYPQYNQAHRPYRRNFESKDAPAYSRDGQKAWTPATASQAAATSAQATASSAMPQAAPAKTRRQLLDLNTADSTALVEISGIGPGTARNIVKYRSLIYFFDDIAQLTEVWGIRPENLERMTPYLTVSDSRKAMPHLRINEMTVDEMGRHKYLGFKEAKILVAYREMHGPYADFTALQQVQGIAPEKLEKLRPYWVF